MAPRPLTIFYTLIACISLVCRVDCPSIVGKLAKISYQGNAITIPHSPETSSHKPRTIWVDFTWMLHVSALPPDSLSPTTSRKGDRHTIISYFPRFHHIVFHYCPSIAKLRSQSKRMFSKCLRDIMLAYTCRFCTALSGT